MVASADAFGPFVADPVVADVAVFAAPSFIKRGGRVEFAVVV